MNQIKKAVLVGLCLATAYAAAETIGTVKGIREGVDGAYFHQARVALSQDGSVAAKVGVKFPVGPVNVDLLGCYTGNPSLTAAVLGDRFGIEGTLTDGMKTATLEGTALGCMAQGTLTSTEEGLSQKLRVLHAQQLENLTAQLGASVTRNTGNAYTLGADVFLLNATKIGSTSLFPYVGASLGKDILGYKFAGCVIAPKESKVSLKTTLGNGGNLTDLKAYTAGLEVRAGLD